jgi:GT2 family glycosyltransferase
LVDRTFLAHRWRAALRVLRTEGPIVLAYAARAAWLREREAAASRYPAWVREHASLDPGERSRMAARVEAFARRPLISVVTPVFDTPEPLLRAAIDSVLAQVYPHWELCVADDASSLPHVREVLEEYRRRDARIKVAYRQRTGNISAASNAALALASGDFIALLDHDDELAPEALFRVALEVNAFPEAAMLYSDEDKLGFGGERTHPNFKPDWNYDLFLSHNIAAHLGVYRADLVRDAGGFREGFEGAQDYDLALRVVEAVHPRRIRHVPGVLYHWRMVAGSTAVNAFEKDYAADRAKRAVEEHLARQHIRADVEAIGLLGAQRIRYPLPDPRPRVETIRLPRGSDGARARNEIARRARGEYLVFLAPGVEPARDDAIDEVVSQAHRAGIGAVAGKLWSHGAVLHAGSFLGAGYAHRGRKRGDPGYMMRADLAQSMTVVSGDCLCVRKSLFEEAGGFDETLDRAFHDVDFCLRLIRMGRRNLFTPFAEFRLEGAAQPLPPCDAEAMEQFREEASILRARWPSELAEDPQYNPNLSLTGSAFSLAWPPRRSTAPTRPEAPGAMRPASKDDVVATVINFNTAPLTLRCMRSLLDAGIPRVLVLDNASAKEDYVLLQSAHAGMEDRVRIIRSETNLGFAAGSNQLIAEALRHAECERVLLVNSDAVVDAEGLGLCLRTMQEARHDLMGGRMLKPGVAADSIQAVDSLGITLYRPLLASNRKSTEEAYLGPTGGFAVYSRRFLEKVARLHGYVFDPAYFCYAEDTDLCVRARLLGCSVGYTDEIVAYHEGQASNAGQYDDFILYHGIRNSIWMVAKCIPFWILVAHLPWVLILHAGIAVRHVLQGRWRTVLRLYRDALAGLPAVLARRRAVQASRRVSLKAFRAHIDPRFYETRFLEAAVRDLFRRAGRRERAR